MARNDWLHRTNNTLVRRTSPRSMADSYGEVFTDVDGKPVSNANWIYDYDDINVAGFSIKYWIRQPFPDDVVTLMDQAARDAVDAAELNARRDAQANVFDGTENYERAFALMLLDEINALSTKINAILDAIDGANNLGAVKTAIAAISDRPIRTITDMKTGLRNKLGT